MKNMNRRVLAIGAVLILVGTGVACGSDTVAQAGGAPQQAQNASAAKLPVPKDLDGLLAPVALYPDQLLAQVLMCAGDPVAVKALDQFLKNNKTLKGTQLQDAVLTENFEPQFVAMALFPQTVEMMANQLEWTTVLGQAFAADKSAVFAAIQRLRAKAREVGNLKTTPQQEVETRTTSSGEEVIVIEPANPQVVYVPQYNPETVYVQSAPSTVVVQSQPSTVVVQDNSADAAVAGLIGFTAGIAIGASMNNNYYYGPYGWGGAAYMYNDAWDDYYDHREDAREDWMDHREDIVEERGDRARDSQEQRTERQENRTENRPEAQQQRTERQQTRQENRPQATEAQRQQVQQQRAQTKTTSTSTRTTQQQSGTRSDAFSGYSSGRSERAASSRGQSSRGASRGGGSRSGGGGRRR
jgi:uncharacterized membrane protein YgcG